MKAYRLLEILTILLRRESFTARAFAQRLGVSERTIRRDIDDLCLAGIPVVTRQGSGGGISIAEGYKLDKRLLLPGELRNIVAGLRALDSAGAIGDIKPLLDKFSGAASEGTAEGEIQIDLATYNRENLSPKITRLRKAIAERRAVSFEYFSDKGRSARCVEPYFLTYKWTSWYLFGYCLSCEDFRLFKLSRLGKLTVESPCFSPREIPPEKKDFSDPWSNEKPMTILFDPSLEYLLVDFYGSDSYERMPDGRLRLTWGYFDLKLTAKWLLRFGSGAEVLKPRALRRAVAREARQIWSIYESAERG